MWRVKTTIRQKTAELLHAMFKVGLNDLTHKRKTSTLVLCSNWSMKALQLDSLCNLCHMLPKSTFTVYRHLATKDSLIHLVLTKPWSNGHMLSDQSVLWFDLLLPRTCLRSLYSLEFFNDKVFKQKCLAKKRMLTLRTSTVTHSGMGTIESSKTGVAR